MVPARCHARPDGAHAGATFLENPAMLWRDADGDTVADGTHAIADGGERGQVLAAGDLDLVAGERAQIVHIHDLADNIGGAFAIEADLFGAQDDPHAVPDGKRTQRAITGDDEPAAAVSVSWQGYCNEARGCVHRGDRAGQVNRF